MEPRSSRPHMPGYGIDFYGDPANACFRIRVATVFGLSSDFTGSPTRWTF